MYNWNFILKLTYIPAFVPRYLARHRRSPRPRLSAAETGASEKCVSDAYNSPLSKNYSID
jgi:hypothetical protein